MRYLSVIVLLMLTGCGSTQPVFENIPQPGARAEDDGVVRGIAVVSVSNNNSGDLSRWFSFIPRVFAASDATVNVTYNNAPSVIYTVNVASFLPGTISVNTLPLGSFTLSAIRDNDLIQCSGVACTKAKLSVYTTGATAGFVNTTASPNYGVPVFTTGAFPSTAVPLGTPGLAQDSIVIPATKNDVILSDFVTQHFTVSSDFSNAGFGNYAMSFVIEYALFP